MQYDEALKNCIFKYVSGSHAYGMNRAGSDEDVRGVFIAPLSKAFDLFQSGSVGSGTVGQRLKSAIEALDAGEMEAAKEHIRIALDPENGDLTMSVGTVHKPGTDEELQELRKFFKLAAESNPNIIEILYIDRLIQIQTPVWDLIRAKRDMFLSKRARWTFAGYAIAQLNRIKTHRGYLINPPAKKPVRAEYGLPDESVIPKDYYGAILTLPNSAVATGLQDVVRKEVAYRDALDHWRSYENWKKQRNQKRAELEAKFGCDTKHASHLVRLARMGREILEKGEVLVFRPDREELCSIRDGAWPYEKIVEFADGIDAELDGLYKTSALRDRPDHKGIANLYREICEEFYKIKIED